MRGLIEDADPIRDPRGFAERETKVLAVFDKLREILPQDEPELSPAKRAELEVSLEDAPDPEEMRHMLNVALEIVNNPEIDPSVRAELASHNPRAALEALDRANILQAVADDARALADEIDAKRKGLPAPRKAPAKARILS